MITKNKEIAAVKALQALIIRGRTMAYEKADYARIADLLDASEYLASFISDKRDMTTTFRENLVTLAKKHKCNMALDDFDQLAGPQ
jgi:hypothetical protein